MRTNWSDYEERYGESREDFIDTAEDDELESCSICGYLFPPDELKFRINEKGKEEAICTECLKEERRIEC